MRVKHKSIVNFTVNSKELNKQVLNNSLSKTHNSSDRMTHGLNILSRGVGETQKTSSENTEK